MNVIHPVSPVAASAPQFGRLATAKEIQYINDQLRKRRPKNINDILEGDNIYFVKQGRFNLKNAIVDALAQVRHAFLKIRAAKNVYAVTLFDREYLHLKSVATMLAGAHGHRFDLKGGQTIVVSNLKRW